MMSHLIYQAERRAADPVGGCYREILHLQILNDEATVRLAELTKIRNSLRALAAAGTQPIFDGQNALRGPAFDGENVLPCPVFHGGNASPGTIFNNVPPQNQQLLPQEGRAEDHNDLLGGGGNGCVVDPLPSTSPYPHVSWDLIEAFLMDDGDEEDQTPMNFSGVQEHQQPTPLSADAGGKVSPSPVFDDVPPLNQQLLPQEGRAEDHNDLLGGGGNGSVVDPLPSTSPYPDIPWDLIEAFLMDDGDEEDQTPMNFSGIQEHQQPMPLSEAARGGEQQDQASTSCEWASAKM